MVSEKRKQRWLDLMSDPTYQKAAIEQLEDQRKNPYAYSQLSYWLSLDLWEKEEGLQVLAGVEPGTIEESLIEHEWINGQPFAEHISFMMVDPVEACSRADYPGDDAGYQDYLETAEHKSAVLAGHQRLYESLLHRLDRTERGLGDFVAFRYRPVQFLAWASSIGFKPQWLEWAEKSGRLPKAIEAMSAPFFDADAEDYPELLHIAVRAWEDARQKTEGTPKQRVLDYLVARYPLMPQGSRDAIAQVVNWQRSGGRPARKTQSEG